MDKGESQVLDTNETVDGAVNGTGTVHDAVDESDAGVDVDVDVDVDGGIFDDVDDSDGGNRESDNDNNNNNNNDNDKSTTISRDGQTGNHTRTTPTRTRIRKRQATEDRWSLPSDPGWLEPLRRAVKRQKQREQEWERHRDPEQFDDDDDDDDETDELGSVALIRRTTHGSRHRYDRYNRYRHPRPNTRDRWKEPMSTTHHIANNRHSHCDDRPRDSGEEARAPTNKTDDPVRSDGNEIEIENQNESENQIENQIEIEIEASTDSVDQVVVNPADPYTADGGLPLHQLVDSTGRKDTRSKLAIQNDDTQNSASSSSSSSPYFQIDERTLFSAPAFPPDIKQEAFDRIYAAIEEPLKLLEDRGYEAYRQYMEGDDDQEDIDQDGDDHHHRRRGDRSRNQNQLRGVFRNRAIRNRNRNQKYERGKEESIRKGLRDALVNGDPREYQRTIFEVARKRNTIVNLGTGAGKTLIALLLIRDVWCASSSRSKEKTPNPKSVNETKIASNGASETIPKPDGEPNETQKKYTLFLVPSVALAIQQSLTLRANLPHLKVETACYASSSSKRARTSLGSCDVIVATHGAIQDLLMHYGDTFSMDRFNLLVIDECHYAAGGNHTYRYLMEKFYHPLEPERRPRVLGLTASPLLNVKENHSDEQLTGMLDTLEKVLDSKIISAAGLIVVPDNEPNLGGSVSVEKDITVPPPVAKSKNNLLYRVIDERSLTYHETNMNRTIPSADNLDLLPSRYREFKQLEHLYKDLGPLVLSIYSSVLRRELSKNVFENESTQRFHRALNHLRRIEAFCNQETKVLPNTGRNDKLLALEELIETLVEENGGTKTIGLVFVERRITAIALHCYFAWRNEQIVDGTTGRGNKSWRFAKHARRESAKSDAYFALKNSRTAVHRGDDGTDEDENVDDNDDQFDDSADDPFHVFQHQNEVRDRNKPSDICDLDRMAEDETDLFHSNRFMDADSDEGYELKDRAEKKSHNDFSNKHDRIAVKSVALVRNPIHIFNSLSMTQKKVKESERAEQCKNWVHQESSVRDVLNKLRRGDVNIMFATSVVEEGVDVQACSFVVAFDGLTSIKGYIQMKGRARKQDAKFFVFRDPHDERRSQLELSVAQKMECRIERIIEHRMGIYAPAVQAMSSHDENVQGIAILPKELAAIEAGVYKVGDATVDIQSAKSLLNRYFSSIPLDPFVRGRKENLLAYMPCFESDSLVLPVHLPSEIRTIKLPSECRALSRREKQKLLSLMACVRLHCYGLLNERLLPLTRKDMQYHILQVATQKLQKIVRNPLNLDSFYGSDRRHLFVHPLSEESHLLSSYRQRLHGKGHSLGLVTTAPMTTISPFSVSHAQFGEVAISVAQPKLISCSDAEFEVLQKIFLILINARWNRKSRSISYETRKKDQYNGVILPYLIGILSSSGEFDWNLMSVLIDESMRSVEERTRAAHAVSPTKQLSEPRIWHTAYNKSVSYVAFGPSDESYDAPVTSKIDGVRTHRDYFKHVYSLDFASDYPLFQCHRMWSLHSGFPTKTQSKACGTESLHFDLIKIPQQAFVEEPLANAHIASLCIFLPQVLYKFEQQQKTEAFVKHCEVHIPTLGSCLRKMDFSRVALAMTSKSCNPDKNYDKLEWVGDAVLKLLQTDSILKSIELENFVRFLHEGDLSMLRSAMGTNDRLKQICTRLQLEDFIMMTPLSRGRWAPCPLQIINQNASEKKRHVDGGHMKLLADVIESMLGVIYLEFGYGASVKVGNELGVTLPWDENDTNAACGESGDIENGILLDVVSRCTGHGKTFSRPKLVSEAFTHPSAIDASVPSYQRLEWIGDAVLCLYTREWLFRNLGQDLKLGELVLLEGAIVSNQTLGFISMKHGLQQYLNHRDQSLPKRIESYCWNVEEGCGFWGGDPPKPIADMVEAMLGAIHVASGFESGQTATMNLMSSVFSIFRQALVEGADKLRDLIMVMKHPKKSLQEMSGQILEVIVCSEHEFASSFDYEEDREYEDNVVTRTSMFPSTPQILHKNEWRNAMRGNRARTESCCVSFVSILGRPLVAVADESSTVVRNRASSLVAEALEQHTNLLNRVGKCRSTVESGLTFATRTKN